MRTSNHLIGLLNFLTFLLSIPILGGGIWLSTRANTTDCLRFLQWPVIVIGASIMILSLAGFAGACYRNTFLMWLYLFCMFFVIVALLGFIIFAYAVTDKGSGRALLNRTYLDYYLEVTLPSSSSSDHPQSDKLCSPIKAIFWAFRISSQQKQTVAFTVLRPNMVLRHFL